jgi:ABC-2 type transport system ATP-binding protein
MVHEPDVLILDEPTSGLDPNQIIEVRKLIQQLAEQHTVILSTHYLQEVDAVATRVIIVNRGQIVADDTRERLLGSASTQAIRARVRGPKTNILAQIGELMPGRRVDVTSSEGDYHDLRVHVTTEVRDRTVPEALAELMVKNGWALAELGREQATLEDVFRSLTTARNGGGEE